MLDIHVMKSQGLSVREISRRVGRDRRTVKRWLERRNLPQYKQRPPVSSKLDPYKEYITARAADGVTNAEVLLREIRQRGYSGGRTILRSFTEPLRRTYHRRSVMRFEVEPGEQAQVDWGTFSYDKGGKRARVYVFVMVMSYSRAMYVEFVESTGLETLIACHVRAFEALGGVPKTVLYDNMKQVILGRNDDGSVNFQPGFLGFASDFGFRPRMCQPYRAQTKGRVERGVGYLRTSFWPGLSFTDLDDLNGQAVTWCRTVANARIHATTGLIPGEELLKEGLQPLPQRFTAPACLGEERQVSRDGFVSWQGSLYGVPWAYACRTVLVKDKGRHLEISSGNTQVALHPKAALKGTRVKLVGQYEGIPLGNSHRLDGTLAIQIAAPDVEARSLAAYEAVGGSAR